MRADETLSAHGRLQMAAFADHADGHLVVDCRERAYPMANSEGTGEPLLARDSFGADVIRFAAGRGVQPHTHEGDHILFVLAGEGWLTYADERHRLHTGLCYLVPGEVMHAIDAETDLVLIAVGNNHRPVDSAERMVPTSLGSTGG